MSLGKIDDVAAAIIMKHFYSNLIAGMSKVHALHEAEQYLRRKDENGNYPFQDSDCNFIPIDAIEK